MGRPRQPPKRTRKQQHRDLLSKARKEGLYEKLFAIQGGVCAICKCGPHPTRRFDMDHDHKTMEIRGLLCRRCNVWLRTRFTAKWLGDVSNYLVSPPARRM